MICAKLHPLISNTLWEQLSLFTPPNVEIYRISYEYLHTEYKVNPINNVLSNKTLNVLGQLENIEQQLKSCIKRDQNNNIVSTYNSSFTNFNKKI